jgi:hypothetical protein
MHYFPLTLPFLFILFFLFLFLIVLIEFRILGYAYQRIDVGLPLGRPSDGSPTLPLLWLLRLFGLFVVNKFAHFGKAEVVKNVVPVVVLDSIRV